MLSSAIETLPTPFYTISIPVPILITISITLSTTLHLQEGGEQATSAAHTATSNPPLHHPRTTRIPPINSN
jgi:hypothetical protein